MAHLPHVHLVIKAHPAETADVYGDAVQDRDADVDRRDDRPTWRVSWPPRMPIVTMNSTVAMDGLVLGLPSLVIGLPNNLSPFVDAGVMLGR